MVAEFTGSSRTLTVREVHVKLNGIRDTVLKEATFAVLWALPSPNSVSSSYIAVKAAFLSTRSLGRYRKTVGVEYLV